MARVTLTVQEVTLAGLELSTAAASVDGNAIPAAGGKETIIYVNNGGGSDITVTLDAVGYAYGIALGDQTVTVTAGEARYISGLDPVAFAQTTGLMHINYSSVTSVTVAAFKIA